METAEGVIEALQRVLGADQVWLGEAIDPRYTHDWSTTAGRRPRALVRPRSTAEVSAALRACWERGQSVATQGGLTGLAGGAVPGAGDVVLSLDRLRGIEEIDDAGATLTVKAGTPLQAVQEAARSAGFLFALDMGARGSCHIGGNIATNAGGNRVIRYGMARDLVLGLEVVLADGTVLPMLNRMVKNNTGYDLKQLFIGAEGTLGVITRAVLKLHPLPGSACTALCAVRDFEAAVRLLRHAQARLAGLVSAFEAMWPDYYEAATILVPNHRPLPAGAPLYVLLDMLGGDAAHDAERFEAMLGEAMERGWVTDAALARSEADVADFWAIRDSIGELLRHFAPTVNFDVSVPIAAMERCTQAARAAFGARWPDAKALFFGHIGDSNLHVVMQVPDGRHETEVAIEETLYEIVRDFGGSISAEHGIGTVKRPFLHYSRSAEELAVMGTLKLALDPKGILNPGKVIAASAAPAA